VQVYSFVHSEHSWFIYTQAYYSTQKHAIVTATTNMTAGSSFRMYNIYSGKFTFGTHNYRINILLKRSTQTLKFNITSLSVGTVITSSIGRDLETSIFKNVK
jgi:hypothetical protein